MNCCVFQWQTITHMHTTDADEKISPGIGVTQKWKRLQVDGRQLNAILPMVSLVLWAPPIWLSRTFVYLCVHRTIADEIEAHRCWAKAKVLRAITGTIRNSIYFSLFCVDCLIVQLGKVKHRPFLITVHKAANAYECVCCGLDFDLTAELNLVRTAFVSCAPLNHLRMLIIRLLSPHLLWGNILKKFVSWAVSTDCCRQRRK